MNFFIPIDNFNITKEKGLPKDGESCFVIFETEHSYSWTIGGYSQKNHNFYINFGYGGFSLDEKEVIAWKPVDNSIKVLHTLKK